MESKLKIRPGPAGAEQRLFLEGRLDAGGAGQLDEYLNGLVREGCHRIILDMSGVDYISSAGIRILVGQYKKVGAIGGLFVLDELSAPVKDVLQMVGMIHILTRQDKPESEAIPAESWSVNRAGFRFVREEVSTGGMSLTPAGDPSKTVRAAFTEKEDRLIRITGNRFGLGIGAIGSGYSDCRSRYGEFLALGEAIVYKPSDGSRVPDYTVRTGQLEPEIHALTALIAEGSFTYRVPFEPLEAGTGLNLSELAEVLSEVAQNEHIVFVVIGENAGLVGVGLNAPPVEGQPLFDFPAIRESVHFTTEPAYARILTVMFGVYSRQPQAEIAGHLRPVKPGSEAGIHAHAAVFPFQALPKGEMLPGRLVRHLFETSIAEDVLHLIHDSREIAGLGESTFKQGVAWIAPFILTPTTNA